MLGGNGKSALQVKVGCFRAWVWARVGRLQSCKQVQWVYFVHASWYVVRHRGKDLAITNIHVLDQEFGRLFGAKGKRICLTDRSMWILHFGPGGTKLKALKVYSLILASSFYVINQ